MIELEGILIVSVCALNVCIYLRNEYPVPDGFECSFIKTIMAVLSKYTIN